MAGDKKGGKPLAMMKKKQEASAAAAPSPTAAVEIVAKADQYATIT